MAGAHLEQAAAAALNGRGAGNSGAGRGRGTGGGGSTLGGRRAGASRGRRPCGGGGSTLGGGSAGAHGRWRLDRGASGSPCLGGGGGARHLHKGWAGAVLVSRRQRLLTAGCSSSSDDRGSHKCLLHLCPLMTRQAAGTRQGRACGLWQHHRQPGQRMERRTGLCRRRLAAAHPPALQSQRRRLQEHLLELSIVPQPSTPLAGLSVAGAGEFKADRTTCSAQGGAPRDYGTARRAGARLRGADAAHGGSRTEDGPMRGRPPIHDISTRLAGGRTGTSGAPAGCAGGRPLHPKTPLGLQAEVQAFAQRETGPARRGSARSARCVGARSARRVGARLGRVA